MVQKLINVIYRKPKSQIDVYKRFGGYFNYQRILRAQKQMRRGSVNLVPVASYADGLPLYFLTGKKYLYQTLFCIQSLGQVSTGRYRFTLVDDGTFDSGLTSLVKKKLPGCKLILKAEIEANLRNSIPPESFPSLHYKRKVYPHIKKLTDIHSLPDKGWKAVVDSDMLFWNNPDELVEWLRKPDKPLFMRDCVDSYGYSKSLMEKLTGMPIHDLLNVGLIGLNSESINWDNVEYWTKTLEEKEGTSYFLEQALSAMLVGSQSCQILPDKGYIVNPTKEQVTDKSGILHHYVDLSKEHYYKNAWKGILKTV